MAEFDLDRALERALTPLYTAGEKERSVIDLEYRLSRDRNQEQRSDRIRREERALQLADELRRTKYAEGQKKDERKYQEGREQSRMDAASRLDLEKRANGYRISTKNADGTARSANDILTDINKAAGSAAKLYDNQLTTLYKRLNELNANPDVSRVSAAALQKIKTDPALIGSLPSDARAKLAAVQSQAQLGEVLAKMRTGFFGGIGKSKEADAIQLAFDAALAEGTQNASNEAAFRAQAESKAILEQIKDVSEQQSKHYGDMTQDALAEVITRQPETPQPAAAPTRQPTVVVPPVSGLPPAPARSVTPAPAAIEQTIAPMPMTSGYSGGVSSAGTPVRNAANELDVFFSQRAGTDNDIRGYASSPIGYTFKDNRGLGERELAGVLSGIEAGKFRGVQTPEDRAEALRLANNLKYAQSNLVNPADRMAARAQQTAPSVQELGPMNQPMSQEQIGRQRLSEWSGIDISTLTDEEGNAAKNLAMQRGMTPQQIDLLVSDAKQGNPKAWALIGQFIRDVRGQQSLGPFLGPIR